MFIKEDKQEKEKNELEKMMDEIIEQNKEALQELAEK